MRVADVFMATGLAIARRGTARQALNTAPARGRWMLIKRLVNTLVAAYARL